MDKSKSALVPEFTNLVNFPAYMSQKQSVNLPEGMRCCVMCGQACPCSTANKTKKCKKLGGSEDVGPHSSAHDLGDKNSGYAIIPTQNKGLCTLCDVNVWVVVSSGLEIKWCKGCKNFRPWAAFGDKGLATKCLRCRDRQREKYALQKEEKEKTRSTTAAAAPHHKLKLSINK
jgi:Zn-finger nucleic acid-binding protein